MSAVCSSLPSMPLTNGAWPTSCLDTAVNGSCTGVCNAGMCSSCVCGGRGDEVKCSS